MLMLLQFAGNASPHLLEMNWQLLYTEQYDLNSAGQTRYSLYRLVFPVQTRRVGSKSEGHPSQPHFKNLTHGDQFKIVLTYTFCSTRCIDAECLDRTFHVRSFYVSYCSLWNQTVHIVNIFRGFEVKSDELSQLVIPP